MLNVQFVTFAEMPLKSNKESSNVFKESKIQLSATNDDDEEKLILPNTELVIFIFFKLSIFSLILIIISFSSGSTKLSTTLPFV